MKSVGVWRRIMSENSSRENGIGDINGYRGIGENSGVAAWRRNHGGVAMAASGGKA